ncbi:tumor necrosis factor receptor superfamily member 5 isoform X3 [Macaca nemestrina]|uniref:tumor necrosis factor receptor superfamily member 5 isoform X3 n=1 Tax=Macaca nemestrina TaxID=9545 RepID=UPI0005F393EA|nr:tumor necrosis factor receptor superfamily member 5 isoform X3 [Macaca nemestrina]
MVRLPLQCVLWGCLLTAVYPEPPTACREKQYLINSQCCSLCQPGQKLVSDCTEFTETECLPCGESEFLDTWNRETRCHQHKYCDPNLGLRVQQKGTSETDTICTCEEGLHCTSESCESCVPHRSCLPGFGVKQIGPQDRQRALVVIPICLGILFVILLLVLVFISESSEKVAKKPNDKAPHPKQEPQEINFLDDLPGSNPAAPVQETLHGCQPVTQEDGKESRISVQERQ